MKSFKVGNYVFLNMPESRMHKSPFKIISKVRIPKLNEFEYCIENLGRKLFVKSDVLYLVDDVQLSRVKRYLNGSYDETN